MIEYLVEIRRRLIYSVIAIISVFLVLFYFANPIYYAFALPLLKNLPHQSMIAIDITGPFLAPLKLSLILSIFIVMPFLFYQLWAFVAPGLYKHERYFIFPLIFLSSVLFYLGVLFAYFVALPLVFAFLTSIAPKGVVVMPDISTYLNFILKLFFAFGISFEVPVLVFLLIKSGITTVEALSEKRRYVIVAAFIIGMLLTPPDVVSQILLAIPIWFLFEAGLLASRLSNRKARMFIDNEH